MAWDTEETRRKLRAAAAAEFSARGPEGTTVDRIAKRAGVNRERLYNYFGGKQELFALILQEELSRVAAAVPLEEITRPEDLGEYAARVFDYHRQHPELTRLLLWEGLTKPEDSDVEPTREQTYRDKSAILARAQAAGLLNADHDAQDLLFHVLGIAIWTNAVPHLSHAVGRASTTEALRRSVSQAVTNLAHPHNASR